MSVRIILNDAPRGYDVVGLRKDVESLGCEIKNLNIWQTDNDEIVISCTVDTRADITDIKASVKAVLRKYSGDFEIQNFTVEVNSVEKSQLSNLPNYGINNKALLC